MALQILRPDQLAPADRAALDRVSAMPFERWAGFLVTDIDRNGAPPRVVVMPARLPPAIRAILSVEAAKACRAVADQGARALFAFEDEAEFRRQAARFAFMFAGDRPALGVAGN